MCLRPESQCGRIVAGCGVGDVMQCVLLGDGCVWVGIGSRLRVWMVGVGWCSDVNLHFVESPALAPPEVQIDLQAVQQYEAELQAATLLPLPDDDEDTFES